MNSKKKVKVRVKKKRVRPLSAQLEADRERDFYDL